MSITSKHRKSRCTRWPFILPGWIIRHRDVSINPQPTRCVTGWWQVLDEGRFGPSNCAQDLPKKVMHTPSVHPKTPDSTSWFEKNAKRPLSVLEGCWLTHAYPYGYAEFRCPPVCVARGYFLPLSVGDTSKLWRKTSLVAWRIPKFDSSNITCYIVLGGEKNHSWV